MADLNGKKVGAPDLAGGEMLALRIELERAGLAQGTDVTVEALGYNELGMAEAVQAGRVAALSIYWSTSAIADHAGIPLRCLTCESEKPQVGMALIVSSNLLASDRQAIAGLGRALAKATHFAWSNPDAAVAVLQKVNPEGSTDVEQLKASMAVAIKAIAPAEGVQYGANDEILLILRHEKEVTDPGYVDFFSSPNNRPADGVHRLVLQVPARGINQVIFQCSFREEAIGGALTRRLEHFLATREYRSYTGYPQT